MKYIITGAAIAWALYMADKYLFFYKKTPNIKDARGLIL